MRDKCSERLWPIDWKSVGHLLLTWNQVFNRRRKGLHLDSIMRNRNLEKECNLNGVESFPSGKLEIAANCNLTFS